MRRVPLVVLGDGRVARRFGALVASRAGDLAGRESLQLEVADGLGPEPSILVDTRADDRDVTPLLDAVGRGHAAATTDLAALAGPPEDFEVLIADRRLGMRAALLAGVPLVPMLLDAIELDRRPDEIAVDGPDPAALVDEVLVIARLCRLPLSSASVVVREASTGARSWRGVVRPDAFPTIEPVPASGAGDAAALVRRVTITWRDDEASTITLAGPPAGPDAIAEALFADVVALARTADEPWRAHRRQTHEAYPTPVTSTAATA